MSKYNELILNNLGYGIICDGDRVQQIFDQRGRQDGKRRK